MSVINQVLNELEKRGTNVAADEAAIRAVPPRRQLHVMRYVILAVALSGLLVLAKWYWGRGEQALPESVAAVPVKEAVFIASAPVQVSAPVETAAVAASDVSAVPQLEASLQAKSLPLVPGVEETVPAVKQTTQHKPGKTAVQAAEPKELPLEDIENRQLKTVSPQQHAESEFGKANLAMQEGRTNDALAGYESALLADPTYKPARRAWVGLLLDLKRNDDAERVLQKGIRRDPHDTQFAMMLARLQVERGDVSLALTTLQKVSSYAEGQGDFYAFVAALLQRQSRHEEAVAQYRIALKLIPNNGLWLMGEGISLQALQRNDEARAAYQQALATNSLSAQLQAYVRQKLKGL